MPRNLDMTALRAFVAVADAGGVTKASGFLNVTQSAVSMQLKRLEESLGQALLDRSARAISLTTAGEQLLSYGRRILALNDEVYGRFASDVFEGEIVLGVPHDIFYPAIPYVLRQFTAEFPRMRVNLTSSYTMTLKKLYEQGRCDMILTTEQEVGTGGKMLNEKPLVWVGAPGGTAWRHRPLRLAFEGKCLFRPGVQRALDDAGIPWEMAVESESSRAIEASVSADMAVHVALEGTESPMIEAIKHNGELPDLSRFRVNLYSPPSGGPAFTMLSAMLEQAYAEL